MKTFQYSTREFVPSVDLNTLGTTFNTLEQGHKEAVKSASDLKVAVSQLDMNEAEDGFKQQLVNEIQDTIDYNTVYGNSYSALDDLILKTGNIASDGRVIGRLRNQQAKKQYDAKVDAMNLPEGMKQMYKDENPYWYKDGAVDNRTGNVLPGDLWKPNTKPVNNIPAAEIDKFALSIAAKDAGGGESVSFLDANGRPTSDPLKSFDGTIYKKVGGKFEALSEDKIRAAYRQAIKDIPGAEDSLRQDYRYAQYQHDKAIKETGIQNPQIEGYTDRYGNVYTYDQWLNNKIGGLSKVAAYRHSYTNVDYGPALSNYRQLQNQSVQQAPAAHGRGSSINTNSAGKTQHRNNIGSLGVVSSGTITAKGNSIVGTENAIAAANRTGLTMLKGMNVPYVKNADSLHDVITALTRDTARTGVRGPGSAANYIIRNYGKNLSPAQKQSLRNAFTGYYTANRAKHDLIKAAGNNRDGASFSYDANNGVFTNNNKYSRDITSELNKVYNSDGMAKWGVGSDLMDIILRSYGTDVAGLKRMGFNIERQDDGNYIVSADANHRNLAPRFAYELENADNVIPGNIGTWLKKTFTRRAASANYVDLSDNARNVSITKSINIPTHIIAGRPLLAAKSMLQSTPTETLSKIYAKGLDAANKAQDTIGSAEDEISWHSYDASSFAEVWWRENGQASGYTPDQVKSQITEARSRVDRMFANGNISSFEISEIDNAGHATRNINDAQSISLLIQKMYADKNTRDDVERSILNPTGGAMGQPKGYVLGFTVPKGKDTGRFKEGQYVRFMVRGGIEEGIDYDPSYNPEILANNRLLISKGTNSIIDNLGYDRYLGNTQLFPQGNDNYATSFIGNNSIMNKNQSESYIANLIRLEQIKPQYIEAYNGYQMATDNNTRNYYYNELQLITNTLAPIINELSNVTNNNPEDVELGIINYLNNSDYE